MIRWSLVLVLLASCGRVNFEPLGGDAGSDAAVTPCRSWGSFQLGSPVPGVGTTDDEWGPELNGALTSIYFYASRPGGMGGTDIWRAMRASPDVAFSPATPVAEVNSASSERAPWISADDLVIVFTTDRGGTSGFDLWQASRTSPDASFDPAGELPVVNSAQNENAPSMSDDGLRLYFTSNRSGNEDIYIATRASLAEDFGVPSPVAALNSPMAETSIATSADELEVFLASTRTGSMGYDIWRSTRSDLAAAFSVPTRVAELSSAGDDLGVSLSQDGSTIFFNYDTVSAGGSNSEISSATRPCLSP